MLIDQWGPVGFDWAQFPVLTWQDINLWNKFEKYTFEITVITPRG